MKEVEVDQHAGNPGAQFDTLVDRIEGALAAVEQWMKRFDQEAHAGGPRFFSKRVQLFDRPRARLVQIHRRAAAHDDVQGRIAKFGSLCEQPPLMGCSHAATRTSLSNGTAVLPPGYTRMCMSMRI